MTMWHLAERWFNNPQGEPSGVCTGQRKPQLSGSSLRTVVVRSCAKKAPRWIDRKCEMYLRHASGGQGRIGEGRLAGPGVAAVPSACVRAWVHARASWSGEGAPPIVETLSDDREH